MLAFPPPLAPMLAEAQERIPTGERWFYEPKWDGFRFDYLQGPRFRHAATFLRWRDDKAPEACLFSQLTPRNPFSLAKIIALSQ